MTNAETYKALIQSAYDNVDEILEEINQDAPMFYVAHHLADDGSFRTRIV